MATTYTWHKGPDTGGGFVQTICVHPTVAGLAGAGGDQFGPHITTTAGGALGGDGWLPRMGGQQGNADVRGQAMSIKFPGTMYVGIGNQQGLNGAFYLCSTTTWQLQNIGAFPFGTTIPGSPNTLRPRAFGNLIQVDFDSVNNVEYVYFVSNTNLVRYRISGSDPTAGTFTTISTFTTAQVPNGAWAALGFDPVNLVLYPCTYGSATDQSWTSGSKVWSVGESASIRTAVTVTPTARTTGVPAVINDINYVNGRLLAASGINSPGTLYSITGNGATWTSIGTITAGGTGGVFAGIDGSSTALYASFCYATTPSGGGLYKSTNGGTTWASAVPATLDTREWGTTEQGITNRPWWYAARTSNSELLGSASCDLSMLRCQGGLGPAGKDIVYVCGSGGAWVSIDSGVTWRPAVLGLNGGEDSDINLSGSTVNWDSVDWGTWQSTNNWQTITSMPNQTPGSTVTTTVNHPAGWTLAFSGGAWDLQTPTGSIANDYFRSALSNPGAWTVDNSNGNVYIVQQAGGSVYGFPSAAAATWKWNWMPPAAVQPIEYNNQHTYWLNTGFNVLGGTNFSTSTIRFDGDGKSVYLAGMQGMWKSDDLFQTVYPAGDGFGGSESQFMSSSGVGNFTAFDTDWHGETTTDSWAHTTKLGSDATGTNVLSVTVAGHTYSINAVTPVQILKDGTIRLDDDYVHGSCVSISGIAADSAGTICIALWGGGILRFAPGPNSGTATGVASFTGAAHGVAITHGFGTGVGTITFTGNATGSAIQHPHAVGGITFTGLGTGQSSGTATVGQWVKNVAQATSGTNSASLTVAVAHAPAIGNMMSVAINTAGLQTIVSVTDDAGNTYAVDVDTDGVSVDCIRFVTTILAAVPSSVTITLSAASAQWVVLLDEWSGITHQNPRLDSFVTEQASGTNLTPSVTSGIASGSDLGVALFGYHSAAGPVQTVAVNTPFASVSSMLKNSSVFDAINIAQTTLQPGIADLRSFAQTTLSNVNTVTFGPPTGARSGDLILAVMIGEGDLPTGNSGNNWNMSLPAGWVEARVAGAFTSGLTGVFIRAFWIPYDPAVSSYTWSWTGATTGLVTGRITAYAISGANLANPFSDGGSITSPSGSPWSFPVVGSTTVNNDMFMYFGYNNLSITGSAGPTLTDIETPVSIGSNLWAFSAFIPEVAAGPVPTYQTNLIGTSTNAQIQRLVIVSANPAAVSQAQASGTMSGAVTGWHVTTLGYQSFAKTTLVGAGVGSLTFIGAASGRAEEKGTAHGTISIVGLGAGSVTDHVTVGSATGAVVFTGSAHSSNVRPQADSGTGTEASTLGFKFPRTDSAVGTDSSGPRTLIGVTDFGVG